MHRAGTVRGVSFIVLVLALAAAPAADAGWRPEGPFLGSVRDLAVDPAKPDTLYVATNSGGVWRSDDGGATWSLPGAAMTGREVTWIEADPGTPGTVWAGVNDPGRPALWRSRDRGATWSRVAGEVKGGSGLMQPTGARIAFAPSAPANVWVPSTNLHYRSRDGGATWSDFRVPGQDAYAIAVDPKNPAVIYAGGHAGEAGTHLRRSDDDGTSWKAAGRGLEPPVKALAVDPVNPAAVYAVTGFNGLWKSTDRGENFTALSLPLGGTDDIYRLVLNPAEPTELWVATEKGLLVSRDGGASWAPADRDTGNYLIRSIAAVPGAPRTVFAASGGSGVYRSDDGGATWRPSSTGLAAGWVKALHASPASATVFAQTSVGLYQRDGSGAWREVRAPFSDGKAAEPGGVLFDPASAQTLYAFDTSRWWRSADGGRGWQEVKGKEPSMRDMMKGNLESAQFKSLAQDPADPKVFYAGSWSNSTPGNAVFKSVDAGKTWKSAGAGLPTEDVTRLRCGAGVVFAVSEKKALYRSTDGGKSWSAVTGLPDAELRDVVLDPSTPGRVLVPTEKGLVRSADNGATWEKAGSALAEEDVEAVVAAPSGALFAGSFKGVFTSTDGGVTWTAMNDGLTNTDVRALAVAGPAPARLLAGTAGGSVFSTELP